jgi:predicted nucleic acid-binding protein
VDASVGVKPFIPDPFSEKATQLFAHLVHPQTELFVPDLFYIECANTLWKYVRAGYIAAADVQADLAQLQALPLQVISTADGKVRSRRGHRARNRKDRHASGARRLGHRTFRYPK